ncbi:hypothetical protein GCM10022237_40210 [Nocardioides ginsengisoli]|uniref:PKD domain-containing protein n=1 Tax=Nocardioides ginsengisoli TaxID=363868 RepID=A0ABW3W8W3_9ACTN
MIAAGLIVTLALGAAHADPPDTGTDDTGFWLHQVQGAHHDAPPPAAAPQADQHTQLQPAAIVGHAACAGADQAAGLLFDVTFCPGADPEPLPLTLGAIRTAFARLPLPAARLAIQPPDGLTLVNFATNFFTTDTHPLLRRVTILGRQVTIRATPSTYTWAYGDGERRTTTSPGAAYPRLGITHRYVRTGRYAPRLSVTYRGDFRVGAQPWRAIPGTVTIDGPPQRLRAVEATPHLVGY